MIEGELADGETAGILVWGDPMLYDSTIRNIEAIAAGGRHQIDFEVIPGITAVQALAARHKIPLNRIAEPVALTTGRKLAEGFPPGIDSVAVLLDGEDTFLGASPIPKSMGTWRSTGAPISARRMRS